MTKLQLLEWNYAKENLGGPIVVDGSLEEQFQITVKKDGTFIVDSLLDFDSPTLSGTWAVDHHENHLIVTYKITEEKGLTAFGTKEGHVGLGQYGYGYRPVLGKSQRIGVVKKER